MTEKKPKQPKRAQTGTLKVGPINYAIVDVPGLKNEYNQDLYGQCASSEGEIRLDPTMEPSRRRATLFHEALHAVSNEYDVGLKEKQVRRLEIGLLNLFRDNPGLLKDVTP